MTLRLTENLIGAVLIKPELFGSLLTVRTFGECAEERLLRIVDAMEEVHRDRVPINLLTVYRKLRGRGSLADVGGAAYLSSLTDDWDAVKEGISYLEYPWESQSVQ